jgi:hypothetical protein
MLRAGGTCPHAQTAVHKQVVLVGCSEIFQCVQVVLVGHSAGGWLGRAFTGDPQWFVDAADGIGNPGMTPSSSNGAKSNGNGSGNGSGSAVGTGDMLEQLQEPEAVPGTCSSVPNPAVRAIVTLGTPQMPPAGGKPLATER